MFSLLYVDDEPGLLEIGKLFLEKTGDFTVTPVLSAREGLAQLRQHDFDAIVSDYQMPEMDGIDFLKSVRESFGNVPFILFTGRGREEVVIEAINNGVDFYLQKGGDLPALFAELSHKIRQAVNRHRAEIALSDSERRLSDLINFLPDATFAIDTRGVVIAWSRAMERMTGVSSEDILGKGNYEYALPFYHERRPLLINLVLEDDPDVAAKYPFVKKEGKTLFSEITIPHFNDGRGAALWFTASPLYNRKGEMAGAIESIREITERKRAEEDLVSANREYTNLLDQIQDVYYRSDTEGRLVRASRSWATLFGYDDISECIGKSIADDFYFNPSERKQVLEEISQKGKVTDYRVLLKKKDGTPVLVEASSHLYYDPAGKIIGIEGTFRDITARKKSEDELRAAYEQITANEEELRQQLEDLATSQTALSKSEEKFRALVETTSDFIWEVDAAGRYTYASPQVRQILGYEPEELVGRTPFDIMPPDEAERVSAEFNRCVSSQLPIVALENTAIKKDGTVVILETSGVVRTAFDGSYMGYRGIDRDITEKRKAADELQAANERLVATGEELRAQYDELAQSEIRIRESEGKYRGIFENTSVAVFQTTIDGSIKAANPAFARMLGYGTADDAIREIPDIRSIYVDSDRRDELYRILAETGAATDFEFALWRRDRTILWVSVNVRAVHGSGGNITGLEGLAVDITKRKEAEVVLREREQLLNDTFSSIKDGISILDTTMTVIRVNRTMEEWYSHELPLVGRKCWEVFQGRTGRCDVCPSYRTLQTGQPARDTVPMVDAGKQVGWLDLYSFPLIDSATGKMTGVIEYVRNITAEKQAQDELKAAYEQIRASEEELRQQYGQLAATQEEVQRHQQQLEEIAGTIPGVIYQFYTRPDGSMGMYYVSNRAVEVLGISSTPDDFFGRFTSRLDPRDREEFLHSIADVTKAGLPWHYEGRFIKPSGEEIWFEGISRPVRLGTEMVYNGVMLDITERKRTENALRESEARFRAVIDQSFQFIGLMTPDGTLLDANRSALTFAGISESDAINRPFWETPWWSHSRDLQEKLKDAIHRAASGETVRFEATHPAADGHLASVDFSVKPVMDPQGRIQYLIPEGRDITEHKRTEEALFNSQQMLQAVLDSIPQRVFWKDRNSVYLGCNLPLAKDAGYADPKDLVGKDDYDTASKATADLYRADDRQVMETGKPRINFEEPQIRPDGSQAWLRTTKVPLRDKDGTIIGVLGTYEDITERKQMEEAIRESEEKYRLISENSPDMIYFIDAGGYVRYVNTPAAKAIREEPADLVGKHLTEIFSPEVARRHMDAIRQVISSGSSLRSEVFEAFPSETIWIDVRLSPLADSSGKVLGVLGLSHNISDRKKAEEALRESEMKYRMLVENSHDIIYTISHDGILTFVSPSWTTLLGHDPAYVAGKSFRQFVHPADVPACEAFLAKVVSTRQRQSGIEYRVIHADGSTRIHTSTISPIFDDTGSIISYIGNARDITEMKQFQNAIRESNRKLNLLSSITRHDVANQLTVVQGYAQLAALRNPDPVTTDFLAKIASAVDMIQHQIEFTRTYQDLGAQAPAWFRLGEVIQSVRPPEITLDCTCRSCEIFADPMIAKVFFNLFDNAVKYGERVTTVTVRCELAGDELVITFADNGIGIPLNEKQKIFEKGFGKHTGFGLFLAREILAITGISIHETGSHGKGARFEIAVPKGAYRTV